MCCYFVRLFMYCCIIKFLSNAGLTTWKKKRYYTPGTPGCYLHRDIYINHSEDVFDNVKNLFRRAESLVIDSMTAKTLRTISSVA